MHDHAHDAGQGVPRLLPFILGALVVLVAAFVLVTKTGLVAQAEIATVEGKVERYAEGTGWVEAAAGDKVISGTRLRTADGRLAVSLPGGSALRLDGNTEVTVVALGRDRLRLDLERGRAYSRVKEGMDWQVQALDATVSAVGTAFSVSADEARRRVGVDVIEESVHLAASVADGKVERDIEEGTYVSVDLARATSDAIAEAVMNPADVRKDPFLGWNVKLDEATGVAFAWFDAFVAPVPAVAAPKPAVKPAPKPPVATTKTTTTSSTKTVTATSPVSSEMRLQAFSGPEGVNLVWTQSSTPKFQGYKVVRSEANPDPTYPNDGYIRFATDRSNTAFLDTGAAFRKTYYYRICRLAEGVPVACGNVVTVTR